MDQTSCTESPQKWTLIGKQGGKLLGWLAPGLVLAFLPKCPLCLMAYVSLLTGIGLTFSQAASLRWGIMFVCLGLMLILGMKSGYRMFARRFTPHQPGCCQSAVALEISTGEKS